MRISDWSSDVCSSDLVVALELQLLHLQPAVPALARDRLAGGLELPALEAGLVGGAVEFALVAVVVQAGNQLGRQRGVQARGLEFGLGVDQRRFGLQRRDPQLGQRLGGGGLGLFDLGVEFGQLRRSEEHTSELQSLMRISYAVFCLKKK